MKIILFNAPPNSGKDYACDFLHTMYGCDVVSFKSRLIDITQSIYGITDYEWQHIYTRKMKGSPSAFFDGMSPRQALIHVSENVIKPSLGAAFFARCVVQDISSVVEDCPNTTFVCPDLGFDTEAITLAETFGAQNVHIVQIQRPGRTFSGDSRRYVNTDIIQDENYHNIFNSLDEEHFLKEVEKVYKQIVSGK